MVRIDVHQTLLKAAGQWLRIMLQKDDRMHLHALAAMPEALVCSLESVDDAYFAADDSIDPATSLVDDVLRCGLLQQLASAAMLRILCAPSSSSSAPSGSSYSKGAPSTGGDLATSRWQRLMLVPELFQRLALSLTQCLRRTVIVAVCDEDDDRVAACAGHAEKLAIASCMLAMSSEELKDMLGAGRATAVAQCQTRTAELLSDALERCVWVRCANHLVCVLT